MSIILANTGNIGNENLTIAVVGYFIVFIALVFLVILYSNLPKMINKEYRQSVRNRRRNKGFEEQPTVSNISGEENASIAMAIYLYLNEMHDEESNIITIRKVSRSYSPWSSKIYGLNKLDKKVW